MSYYNGKTTITNTALSNHIWAKKGGLLIEFVANCSTI